MNKIEGNRYLGFYFRYDNKRKVYIQRIKMIINKAIKLMRWKKLSDKQITTVWNIVIIPRIEYQMSGVILRKTECDKLIIN
jgi:hypothetical protein